MMSFAFTQHTKNIIGAGIFALLLVSAVFIFFNSPITCAYPGGVCGNNGGQVGSNGCGGCNAPGGGSTVVVVNPPPPPPPPSCSLTVSSPVVQAGTTTVQLSWTPTPSGAVNLSRNHATSKTITVPSRATTANDVLTAVAGRPLTYSLSYNAPYGRRTATYQCSASVTVVTKLTECNDGVDNADTEDSLADRFDPGCHTDGNPNNSSTYDPLDMSETNGPPDMVPSVDMAARGRVGFPISVTTTAENRADVAAEANTLVYGWRNVSASAAAPSCGSGILSWWSRSRCFEQGGKTYRTLYTYDQSYNARQKRTAPIRSFRPSEAGRYEVCAVTDFNDILNEGIAGERNNNACAIVIVDPQDPNAPPTPGPTITGPVEITVSPGRVRKGTETAVTWNTNGREQCTITGTNGHVINLTGGSSVASERTPAITSETTYVIQCADDGARAEGKVGILPVIQEI